MSPNHPKKGETWCYIQSVRPYVVLDVKDGNVIYTTLVVSPAMLKIFVRTITEFKEKFKKYEDVTSADHEHAIRNTLEAYGQVKR